MSRYGKVETGFWYSIKVRPLSEKAKYLLLYLLSCPHGNVVGCFVLPDGYISADLGWPLETVSVTVSELFEKGLIARDKTCSLTRIIGWWGHNTIENANVAKHAAKEICSLPNCEVRQGLIDAMILEPSFHETVRQTLSERLPKPIRNQEPNPTQPEPKSRRVAKATAPTNEGFEEFWKAYPKRKGDNPRKSALKAFEVAVRAGADPKDIIAGVKLAASRNADKIGTQFIPAAVKWLHDERWKDHLAKGASANPEPPQTDWRAIVGLFQRTGTWPRDKGPGPDLSGCRAPPEILREFGYGPRDGPAGELKLVAG